MPRKSWWARLPFGVRMTAGAGALAVLLGGGAAAVATLTVGGADATTAQHSSVAEPDLGAPKLDDDPEVVSRAAAAAEPLPQRHTGHTAVPTHVTTTAPATDQLSRARSRDDRADRTGPRAARTPAAVEEPAERVAPASVRPPASAAPVVTTRTDVETRAIPFPTRLVRDPSLPRGTRRVQSPGVPGEETLRYEVTMIDGKPAQRQLVDTTVTRKPEPRVVVFGARRYGRDCEGAGLRLCVPLGRSAACPPDRAGRSVAGEGPARTESDRTAGSAAQLGGSDELSEEDLRLLSPETLDGVRLEPATLC